MDLGRIYNIQQKIAASPPRVILYPVYSHDTQILGRHDSGSKKTIEKGDAKKGCNKHVYTDIRSNTIDEIDNWERHIV